LQVLKVKKPVISLAFAFYILIGVCLADTATLETIPLHHWSYEVIDELVLRGYLTDLALNVRPFTRIQVYHSLSLCQIPPEDKTSQRLLDFLKSEFQIQSPGQIKTGFYLTQDLKADESGLSPRSQAISKVGYSINDKLALYNGIRLDQNLQDDTLYSGAYWRGFSGYTEQAYISGRIGPMEIQFGKDWQKWGSGRYANLLISDNPPPYDLFRFCLNAGKFKFTSVIMQLNAIAIIDSISTPGEYKKSLNRRFLSAHRIDWHLSKKVQLGIAEAVLYGGENRTFEWQFINPVIFYHGEQENRDYEGNTLVSADFRIFPGKKWMLYGEFLVDDIQFDRKVASDLEPPEMGWIAGARKAGPWGWKTATIGGEYSGVTNRTYNTLQPQQKYLFEDYPIGHSLGNDFDRWTIELSNWFLPELKASLLFSFIRNGESSVYAPFDTSFYLVPEVSMGYCEAFPTGTIEKTYRPEIKLWYYHNRIFTFHSEISYDYIENYQNTKGEKEKDFAFRMGALADLNYFLNTE